MRLQDSMRSSGQIRKYRTEAGFTQEKLAEIMDVSPQSVSNWESGKNAPDIDKLVDLARVLNTSVGRLLEETPSIKDRKRSRLFNEEHMYNYGKM